MTKILRGRRAIQYARRHGLTLRRDEDPTEPDFGYYRSSLTPDQAHKMLKRHPNLIFVTYREPEQEKHNASKRSAQKRISAALTKFLKKQNPAMKRATHVRVKKLKGGGISILPA